MAAQLIAAHNAAMECYRRAMLSEQTFEGRRENLAQANKLSAPTPRCLKRSIAIAARASRRSRSNMSTSIPADRRWSGWSKPRGVGINRNQRINPMQSKLPMHCSRRCGGRTRNGSPCRSPAMPNGRCRMHGGLSPGAPKGNRNAFKHGRYTAETLASRREVAALGRAMRALADATDEGD
jgi:hypothetical protein